MGILKASRLLKVVGQLYMTVYVHGYTLKASGLLKVVGQLYMTIYVHGYTLKASGLLKVVGQLYMTVYVHGYTQSKQTAKSSGSTIYDYLRPWVYSKQAVC